MKKIQKICILCGYSFPEGMAPTTRILAYSKGMKENGVDVEIVSFERIQNTNCKRIDGVVKGIPYHTPFCYNPKKYNNRIYRVLWANWKLRFSCIKELVNSNRNKKVDYVFFSFDTPLTLLFYGFFLRLHGIKTAFIGDEFPEPIRQLKNKVPNWMIGLYRMAYKFISVRILMTKNLQTFYDNEICLKPTYILSSVIDTDRFENITKEAVDRPYLCYMGNMMLAKDNVDNIIRAFALVASEFQNLDLHLYGLPNEHDREIVETLIKQYNLENRILLKGKASYDEVPQILGNAKILVTSQPLTKRAQGGFPTKMCEYMMTGKPSLLTDVGEINQYVKDGETVFMVEACNPQKYAEKLRYILTHYEEALNVAERGKQLVVNTYGAEQATKGLVDFLSELSRL